MPIPRYRLAWKLREYEAQQLCAAITQTPLTEPVPGMLSLEQASFAVMLNELVKSNFIDILQAVGLAQIFAGNAVDWKQVVEDHGGVWFVISDLQRCWLHHLPKKAVDLTNMQITEAHQFKVCLNTTYDLWLQYADIEQEARNAGFEHLPKTDAE